MLSVQSGTNVFNEHPIDNGDRKIDNSLKRSISASRTTPRSHTSDSFSSATQNISWETVYAGLIDKIKPSHRHLSVVDSTNFSKKIDEAANEASNLVKGLSSENDPGKITKLKDRLSEATYKLLSLTEGKGHEQALRLFSRGVAEIAKSLRHQEMGWQGKNDHRERGEEYFEKAVKQWEALKAKKESIDNYLNSLKMTVAQEVDFDKQGDRNGDSLARGQLVRKGDQSLRVQLGFGKKTTPTSASNRKMDELILAMAVKSAQLIQCFPNPIVRQLKKIEAASAFEKIKDQLIERLTDKFDQLIKDVNGQFSRVKAEFDPEKISESRELLKKIDDENITKIINQIKDKLSVKNSFSEPIKKLSAEGAVGIREGLKAEYYTVLRKHKLPGDEPKHDHFSKSQKHLENVSKICDRVAKQNAIQNLKDRTEQWKTDRKYDLEMGEGRYSPEILYHFYFSPDIAAKNIVLNERITISTGGKWNKFKLWRNQRELNHKWEKLTEIRKSLIDANRNREAMELANEYRKHKMAVPNEIKCYPQAMDLKKLNAKFAHASNAYQRSIEKIWNAEMDQNADKLGETKKAFHKSVEFLKSKGKANISASQEVTLISDLSNQEEEKINSLCQEAMNKVSQLKGKDRKTVESAEDQRKRAQFRARCIVAGVVAGVGIGLTLLGIVAWPLYLIGAAVIVLGGAGLALYAIKKRYSSGSSCSIVPCL